MFFKFKKNKKSESNLFDSSNIIKNQNTSSKIHINIIGKNNIIQINKLKSECGEIFITIFGDNCSVKIFENFFVSKDCHILIGLKHNNYKSVNNSHLIINKNTSIESARIITFNSNNTISIGEDCMISENVIIYNTDSHPIYNLSDNKIINPVKDLKICDHVWIGMDVKILKNSIIPKNSIIGAGSIVSGRLEQENCIYGGVPARKIKSNIKWSRKDINWVDNLNV